MSVEVAQDETYDEVEDAIIKQYFPEGYVAVITGKCDALGSLIYPLNKGKTIYKAECVKRKTMAYLILKYRIFINSIVCTTPAAFEEHFEWSKTDDYNSQLQEMCQRNGWNYVDISDITNHGEDKYYQQDGVHYIQDLYPVWAERMIGETIKVIG